VRILKWRFKFFNYVIWNFLFYKVGCKSKVKLSHYMLWRHMGGEEV
jgi:hypothetical protein